jgi:hypothetical protein
MIVLGEEETELPEDGTRHRKTLKETLRQLHFSSGEYGPDCQSFPSGKSDPANGKAH